MTQSKRPRSQSFADFVSILVLIVDALETFSCVTDDGFRNMLGHPQLRETRAHRAANVVIDPILRANRDIQRLFAPPGEEFIGFEPFVVENR